MLSKLLIMAAGAAAKAEDYWLATLELSGYTVTPLDIAIGQDKSVYIVGQMISDDYLTGHAFIVKYAENGAVSWQLTLGLGDIEIGFQWAYGVAVGSDNNVYVAGRSESDGGGFVHSYTSSGSVRWKRVLDSGGFGIDSFQGIGIDASNNVYATGFGFDTELVIVKYNSSGVLQFQRELASAFNRGEGIYVDADGNSYIAGANNPGTWRPLFAKYNSSGVLQWQRVLATAGSSYFGVKAAVRNSSVYFTTTKPDAELLKYNTDGVLQWQRQLSTVSTRGITTDIYGNVYICGTNYIVKYDSSGNVQWQRQITNTSGYNSAKHYGRAVYVIGGSSAKAFVAKLPDDGSLTGTYGSFVYQAASLTSSAGTATSSTSSFVSFTTSSTDFAGALPVSTGTLTSTKVDI